MPNSPTPKTGILQIGIAATRTNGYLGQGDTRFVEILLIYITSIKNLWARVKELRSKSREPFILSATRWG